MFADARRARDAGRVETMSLPRRGRARPRRARDIAANGKALSGEKPWKRGLPRARTCMRSARRSLRSRCACAECFSLDASRRTRRRFGRGEFGGESGPPTVDAPAARSDVASASAPASTSESLLPAGRHIDGRDTEVGIAVSNGKRRKRRTRATRGVLSLDASTRGRYCRGARPSRQSRSLLRLGKRVQKKIDDSDKTARPGCERFGRAAVRGRRLAQWLGIVSVPQRMPRRRPARGRCRLRPGCHLAARARRRNPASCSPTRARDAARLHPPPLGRAASPRAARRRPWALPALRGRSSPRDALGVAARLAPSAASRRARSSTRTPSTTRCFVRR